MSISQPSQQIRSTQRPIPLRGRTDLVVRPIEFQGVTHFVIKDPVALTYNRLRSDQYRVLKLLDGRHHLEEIRDDLIRAFPSLGHTLNDVQQLIADLHQKGLAFGLRTGQAASRIEQRRKKLREKIWQTLSNILSLRLPGWDPDAALTRLLRWTAWLFHPATVSLLIVAVLSSWLLLATNFNEFVSRLPAFRQFFGWPNLIVLWITLAGAKILHEFGHGLTCKYFGAECHEMGVILLVGTPTLYCDVSDSWMLKNKWSRILIGAGGMIVEVVLSAFAIFGWWFTEPGLLHYLCLNLLVVTAVPTIIFNANPLMQLDGYYMLSDYLEIPNLRSKADQLLRNGLAKMCLGINPPPDPFMPKTGLHWFRLFAVASTTYGWVVLFGILTFLYTVLKPYGLQSIGQTLAVISVIGVCGKLMTTTYRIVSAPRQNPISRWRLGLSIIFVSGIGLGLGMIPFPLIHSTAFVIEPRDVHHVFTKVPGELIKLNIQPGDHVAAGQQLALLRDPNLEDRQRDLEVKQKSQLQAIKFSKALDNPEGRTLAEGGLQTVERQLAELAEQRGNLSVTAPVGGRIVEPPGRPAVKLEQMRTRLVGWTGTPLAQKNNGSFLEERTHLLSIAPTEEMQAILYVDQADRHEIHVGLSVGLMFEHLPGKVFRGRIAHIASAHSDFAPENLTVKYGGRLSTVTDHDGREQLQDAAYQATVYLDESPELLKPNLRGSARFIAARRSAFSWLWRSIRRNFHFRM